MSIDSLLSTCRNEVRESGRLSLPTRHVLATSLPPDVLLRVALQLGRHIRSLVGSRPDANHDVVGICLDLFELVEAVAVQELDKGELLAERDAAANAIADAGTLGWAASSAANALVSVSDVVLYGFHVARGVDEKSVDREMWDAWFWGALFCSEGFPWVQYDAAKLSAYWMTVLDWVSREVARAPRSANERYEGAYEGRPPHLACVLARDGRAVRKVLRVHHLEKRQGELVVTAEVLESMSVQAVARLVVDCVWVELMGKGDLVDVVRLVTRGETGDSPEVVVSL